MKKYHINYANGRYLQAQQYCSESARRSGFDHVISYSINDIDRDFYSKNSHILSQPRGAGYWLWKPYLINKTLQSLNDGDLLVYSDSGSYYQSSPQPLFELIQQDPNGVLSFELIGLNENIYTKRDTFVLMGLDEPKYTETSQREATYIWLIKNEFTTNLVKEYLEYAQNEKIITDIPSENPNYPVFKDHRHDQSIWSLLCKKHNIKPHRLISQWGNGQEHNFPGDNYSQITLHHRNPI
jgi:hypothetical protein